MLKRRCVLVDSDDESSRNKRAPSHTATECVDSEDEAELTSEDEAELTSEDEAELTSEEESDSQESAHAYIPKKDRRKMYEKYADLEENQTYEQAAEHYTQLDAEALWRHIQRVIGKHGHKYGLVAKEVDGERLIMRVGYGSRYAGNAKKNTGYYERILVPLIEELFCQKAYQPHPVNDLESKIPKYAFKGWEMKMYVHDTEDFSILTQEQWCICCQNYLRNNLKMIHVMRHKESGICILTGGTCSGHMLASTTAEEEESCGPCDVVDTEKWLLAHMA